MKQEDVKAAVEGAVRAKVASYASNDHEKYFGMFADDVTIMFEIGRWTKNDYATIWTGAVEGGHVKVVSSAVEDLRIQVLPGAQAAVASYFMPSSYVSPNGALPQGVAPEVHYRQCEVWVQVDGEWKIVNMTWISSPPPAAR